MMRAFVILKIALRALRRNKMRSVLTALGIIIGVAAVIATVAIGSDARSAVEAQIASLGQNILLIFPGSTTSGGMRGGFGSASTLTLKNAKAIRNELAGVAAVSPTTMRGRTVTAGAQNWPTRIEGQGEEYFQIRDWRIAEGDFFTATDVQHGAKVAVLGATVASQLFPDGDPVGKSIRVRDSPLVVAGVLAPKGANMTGQDQDDLVVVPVTTMRFVAGATWLVSISVQAATSDYMPVLKDEITALLRQRHRIEAGREDDFTVRTQDEIADAASQTAQTMTWLLGSVATVSLVVGGIGIMNIMLVSVTERTREIGTRIAVGAKSRDIMLQFLVEAVVLSILGGVLGIGLGFAASEALAKFGNMLVEIPPWVVGGAVGFSAIVGIFFGFYPAQKASRLDPIEALRFE